MTYIYALIDPRTQVVRYVGKADKPHERLKRHTGYQLKDDTYKSRWLRSLISEGLCPELIILDKVAKADWVAHECKWIAFYRIKSGTDLTNGTEGGDGAAGLTAEGRRKKIEKMSGVNNPFYGKKHPPGLQAKLDAQKRGRNNHWFGTQGPMGGKIHSEETKQKISEKSKGHIGAMRGKQHALETKIKISKALIGITRSTETRKKMADAARSRAPNYYIKMVETRKAKELK